MSLSHRTGTSAAGPQKARLVPCKRSQFHGHHPENEACPMCPAKVRAEMDFSSPWWWVSPLGDLYDFQSLAFGEVEHYSRDKGFRLLSMIQPETETARMMCWCWNNGGTSHRIFRSKAFGAQVRLCRYPAMIKSDEFEEVK